jgi:predicted nucleic acid-binding protein
VTPVLVDSNVIIDVATGDARWSPWSAATLRQLAEQSALVINPIVYGELAVGYETIEELDAAVPRDLFRREEIPWEAAFLAGRCFLAYRRRGGERATPLPDFIIGAHAAIAGYRLVTRDPRVYRTYFPSLDVVAPG